MEERRVFILAEGEGKEDSEVVIIHLQPKRRLITLHREISVCVCVCMKDREADIFCVL